MVNFSYKFRLYPSATQQKLLNKMFGCSRFVWNYFLNKEKEHYLNNQEKKENERTKNYLSYIENANELTKLKKQEETKFLKEANSQALQSVLKNLDIAYKSFFKKTAGFPSFKKKHGKQSFVVHQGLLIENNNLFIPKFKEGIKIVIDRPVKGRIISGTVSKTKTDKFFVSLCCERNGDFPEQLPKNNNAIGIDLGIKSFAFLSNGEEINNPKFFIDKEKKIKYEHRQLSRKKKGSNNRNKQRLTLARVYEKVSNQKNDFLQKLSTRIIRENQMIVLEDLNVKGMMGNHKLAKAIQGCSWSAFVGMLKYKADWYGRELIFIDRFFPSSKTCFDCGWINNDLTLKNREWSCLNCGVVHQRDWNASKVILNQGLNVVLSGCGTQYTDIKQKLDEAPGCNRGRRNKKLKE